MRRLRHCLLLLREWLRRAAYSKRRYYWTLGSLVVTTQLLWWLLGVSVTQRRLRQMAIVSSGAKPTQPEGSGPNLLRIPSHHRYLTALMKLDLTGSSLQVDKEFQAEGHCLKISLRGSFPALLAAWEAREHHLADYVDRRVCVVAQGDGSSLLTSECCLERAGG